MKGELWLIQAKIGKEPWKLADFYRRFFTRKEAREQAAYMTKESSRWKYRAVRYVPMYRGKNK